MTGQTQFSFGEAPQRQLDFDGTDALPVATSRGKNKRMALEVGSLE